MPKAYIIVRSTTSYPRYITRSTRNGYHCKKRFVRKTNRFLLGAGDRDRTGTRVTPHGILSPGRLPVSPHRHVVYIALYHYLYASVNQNRACSIFVFFCLYLPLYIHRIKHIHIYNNFGQKYAVGGDMLWCFRYICQILFLICLLPIFVIDKIAFLCYTHLDQLWVGVTLSILVSFPLIPRISYRAEEDNA